MLTKELRKKILNWEEEFKSDHLEHAIKLPWSPSYRRNNNQDIYRKRIRDRCTRAINDLIFVLDNEEVLNRHARKTVINDKLMDELFALWLRKRSRNKY